MTIHCGSASVTRVAVPGNLLLDFPVQSPYLLLYPAIGLVTPTMREWEMKKMLLWLRKTTLASWMLRTVSIPHDISRVHLPLLLRSGYQQSATPRPRHYLQCLQSNPITRCCITHTPVSTTVSCPLLTDCLLCKLGQPLLLHPFILTRIPFIAFSFIPILKQGFRHSLLVQRTGRSANGI